MSSDQALLEEQNTLLKEQNELLKSYLERLDKQGQAMCRFQNIMGDAMVVLANAVMDTDSEETIMSVIQDGFTNLDETLEKFIEDVQFQAAYDETVGDDIFDEDEVYDQRREL